MKEISLQGLLDLASDPTVLPACPQWPNGTPDAKMMDDRADEGLPCYWCGEPSGTAVVMEGDLNVPGTGYRWLDMCLPCGTRVVALNEEVGTNHPVGQCDKPGGWICDCPVRDESPGDESCNHGATHPRDNPQA
jgi:hypothetical protein